MLQSRANRTHSQKTGERGRALPTLACRHPGHSIRGDQQSQSLGTMDLPHWVPSGPDPRSARFLQPPTGGLLDPLGLGVGGC